MVSKSIMIIFLLLLSIILVCSDGKFFIRDLDGDVIDSVEPELLKRIHQDLLDDDRQSNATDLLSTYDPTTGYAYDRVSRDLTSQKRHKRAAFTITMDAHIGNHGWSNNHQLGQVVGTEGQGKRLEAYRINSNPYTADISYRSHVQNIGWQNYVETNEISGTTGQSFRIEAIQINIGPSIGQNVYYRCHLQNVGWTKWVRNNEVCGTTGESRQLEAFVLTLLVF